MLIDSGVWQLEAASVSRKQYLLAYAASCGVKVAHSLLGHDTDNDLFVSWISDGVGLGSLPRRHEYRITASIAEGQFIAMCEAYAWLQQPAEEHFTTTV